jgi:hypothetical protein
MFSVPPRTVGVFAFCVLVAAAAPAPAQPAAPIIPVRIPAWNVAWSAEAGTEWYSLRDIARIGPPVDGSPVAWTGRGPTLVVRFDRERPKRLIRAEVTVASIGRFSYDMGVRTAARPAGDHAFRLDGRYELRWYPFRNLLTSGLDIGAGVQGLAGYVSIDRQMPPDIQFGQNEIRAGAAIVTSLRFHHWERFRLEATLVNGGMVARTTQHHSAAADATMSSWGGGWLTDLSLAASARLVGRTSIALSYLNAGEGHLGSHRGYATSRGHLMLGVTYAR